MSAKEELNLAGLPSDVIRSIINAAQASINSMMLISPRWNAVALSHLSDRNALPVIKYLSWRIGPKEETILNLFVPETYHNFFGGRWKPKNRIPYTLEDIDDGTCLLFERVIAKRWIKRFLARLTGRCSHLERLELIGFNVTAKKIAPIRRLMRDLMVDELFLTKLNLDRHCKTEILNLIRSNPINRIVLSPREVQELSRLERTRYPDIISHVVSLGSTAELMSMELIAATHSLRYIVHVWNSAERTLANINSVHTQLHQHNINKDTVHMRIVVQKIQD